ncbi:PREDICTED: UDP-glycosyltransferase 73B4-like [Fragaria vesca subsp. vesca]|uniref:UDP-glycosyltransferase 73B4-like n=1 Tax=Fragaria vesca subsp. vesca TaxID=101020 RepID=UPI0002C2FF2D|nr:PREDICTED: UDP-glycosyltransferase 73B4-like [Fragaria vesca subsp. vesca]
MASPPLEPHVVIFPFMAHGHTLPLLDLSKALSHRRIKVTIFTTPSNAKSISNKVGCHPNIIINTIPFPTDIDSLGLPRGIENTSQLPSMEFWLPFVLATKQLQKPFEQVLQSMHDSKTLPICVISDFFFGWTLESCRKFGVPRLVFHGMGVLSMAICKSVIVHRPYLKAKSVSDPLDFPGLKLPFLLNTSELPETLLQIGDANDPFAQFMFEVGEADINSWGVIVNSFEELESGSVSSVESFYENGAKAWCLGPLNFYDKVEGGVANINREKQSLVLTEWLNEQVTPGSVIYIAFGTQADMSEAQLDEVVFGLEEAGVPFVFVVRSTKWSPPNRLKERLKGKGLIAREWVDQRQILAHRAVGGFLSHCGWNSVIESISAGVPILAWPMIAEQSLNAKLVAEGLGAGLAIKKVKDHSRLGFEVSRQAIRDGVRELMLGGEKGRNAKERAQALGRVAWLAVQEGGSSYQALDKLIDQLRVSSILPSN